MKWIWGFVAVLGLFACSDQYRIGGRDLEILVQPAEGIRLSSFRYQGIELLPPQRALSADHALHFSNPFNHQGFRPLLSDDYLETTDCHTLSQSQIECRYQVKSGVQRLGDFSGIAFQKTFRLKDDSHSIEVETRIRNSSKSDKQISYTSLNNMKHQETHFQENGMTQRIAWENFWEFSPMDHDQNLVFLSLESGHYLAYRPDPHHFRHFLREPGYLHTNYHPMELKPEEEVVLRESFTFLHRDYRELWPPHRFPTGVSDVDGSLVELEMKGSLRPRGMAVYSDGTAPRFSIKLFSKKQKNLKIEVRDFQSNELVFETKRSFNPGLTLLSPSVSFESSCYRADLIDAQSIHLAKSYFCVGQPNQSFYELLSQMKLPPLKVALIFHSHMPWGYESDMRSLLPTYNEFFEWFGRFKKPINLQVTARALELMEENHKELFQSFNRLAGSNRVEMLASGRDWNIIPLLVRHFSEDFALEDLRSDISKKRKLNWKLQGLFLPELVWSPDLNKMKILEGLKLKYLVLDNASLPKEDYSHLSKRFIAGLTLENDDRVLLRNSQLSHALWKQKGSSIGIWVQELRKRFGAQAVIVGTDLEQLHLASSYVPGLKQFSEAQGVEFVKLSSLLESIDPLKRRLQASSWQGDWSYWNASDFDHEALRSLSQSYRSSTNLQSDRKSRIRELLHRSLDGGHFWFENNKVYESLLRRIDFELQQD